MPKPTKDRLPTGHIFDLDFDVQNHSKTTPIRLPNSVKLGTKIELRKNTYFLSRSPGGDASLQPLDLVFGVPFIYRYMSV